MIRPDGVTTCNSCHIEAKSVLVHYLKMYIVYWIISGPEHGCLGDAIKFMYYTCNSNATNNDVL